MKKYQTMLPVMATWFFLIILISGCVAFSLLRKKQESLEERANNYMQAQVDKDWNYAYSFFDVASKKNVTRDNYVNQINIRPPT